MDEQSHELMGRWQDGDESAAAVLFRRYFTRLHALVQTRLSQRLSARLDAEDVVQSVFHSFFTGARDGRFVLKQAGDLWRLLAAITINKIRNAERRHSAGKRDLGLEQLPSPEGPVEEAAWLAHDPAPEEATALTDELEALLRPRKLGSAASSNCGCKATCSTKSPLRSTSASARCVGPWSRSNNISSSACANAASHDIRRSTEQLRPTLALCQGVDGTLRS